MPSSSSRYNGLPPMPSTSIARLGTRPKGKNEAERVASRYFTSQAISLVIFDISTSFIVTLENGNLGNIAPEVHSGRVQKANFAYVSSFVPGTPLDLSKSSYKDIATISADLARILTRISELTLLPLALCHIELSAKNIILSGETKIASIVNWEGPLLLPLGMNAWHIRDYCAIPSSEYESLSVVEAFWTALSLQCRQDLSSASLMHLWKLAIWSKLSQSIIGWMILFTRITASRGVHRPSTSDLEDSTSQYPPPKSVPAHSTAAEKPTLVAKLSRPKAMAEGKLAAASCFSQAVTEAHVHDEQGCYSLTLVVTFENEDEVIVQLRDCEIDLSKVALAQSTGSCRSQYPYAENPASSAQTAAPAQEDDQPFSCCSGDDNDDNPVIVGREGSIALQGLGLSTHAKVCGRRCCGAACCTSPIRRGRHLKFLWEAKRVPCCTGIDGERLNYAPVDDTSPADQDGKEKVLTLMVVGMDCPACSPRVEQALKGLGVTDIKVEFVSARASCSYISGSIDPETIRRKVENTTGFICTIASLRNGQRTLRVSFSPAGAPAEDILQALFGREQGILKISRADVRFTIDSAARHPLARDIHGALLGQGWMVTPVNENDGETAIDKAAALDLRRSIWRFLLSAILTIPVLVISWSSGFEGQFALRGGIALGLASLVQIFCAGHITLAAGRATIADRRLDADVLISLSSLSAYLYSMVSYGYNVAKHRVDLDSFFETSTLLITPILLGRLVSVYARNAARRSSVGLTPPPTEAAHWIDPKLVNSAQDIHTALLEVDDTVVVHAAETIPSDGIVVTNTSDIDESLITGETVPITKGPGAPALAGTTALGPQSLYIRLSKTVQDNSLAELRRLTAEARSSRAPIQDTADRIARRVIPIVLAVSAISFSMWTLVLKYARHESPGKAVADGLSYAVAVLALSCPCALTLCVPLVVLYARNASQKSQFSLLFKSSAALQNARAVTHVIFDKTGTLTTGKMRAVESNFDETSGIWIAEHPVSAAVARYLAVGADSVSDLDNIETVVGKDIQANWNGSIVRGGSVSWCAVQDVDCVVNMLDAGKNVFAVTVDHVFLAAFGLEDDLRSESTEVVSSLVARGITVSILSGDHQKAVDGVRRRLGVEGVKAKGNCLPEDKRNIQKNIVVFVGDGSNDTAALAQADIGVSLVSGTAIAINSADTVILSGSLRGLLQTITVSRLTWRRIVLSLTWALSYNVLAVLFGSGLLVDIRVQPQWAGLGEFASLVPVLAIAQSCRFFK
ncbi:heavy metal translocatin [Guyanagaster necrorhizus]|uniref:Heavy metal translocatin n=1 Tax=Guyanagaster necrorhizus TaxID=856835 RepID=A0A9P7VGJ1_9AGAR|nr:heavy metal translocatin [Guyanagaster necrorhizus MCA 3950]KAG7440147.1 heavy metal translocatin [Guyanagaster necrorhizus MCA 3950]